jgi:hypothetical protein
MIRSSRLLPGAALLAGLLAAANPTARAADPDKLIPADADTVVSVDVKKLLEADFVKKFVVEDLKKQFDKQEAKQFLTDIGLDPFKDVERLVVASMETKFAPGSQPNYLVVVRGSFDAEKLFKRAEAETRTNPDKYSMVKDGGTTMFKIVQQPPQGSEPERAAFATVIDDKTVVFASDKKYVTEAIKRNDSGKGAALKKELAELIKKVDARVPIYVASVVSGKLGDIPIPPQAGPVKLESLGKALPNTETILVTVRIGTDVAVDLHLGMKDEETANDMRNAFIDLIDQVKPLAKLASNFDPATKPLPDLLDAIRVTSKKKDMILTLTATGNDLGGLLQFQQRRAAPKKNKH